MVKTRSVCPNVLNWIEAKKRKLHRSKCIKIRKSEKCGRRREAMTEDGSERPAVSELRLNPEKTTLSVAFANGFAEKLPAEFLRVVSPSAEVQGHSPSERKLVPGKKNVTIRAIEPVGNYAVRLVFSDGHDTGIYSWSYLYDVAAKKEELWSAYLEELAGAGLSRDR
jgi:DUF971 family protein